METWDDEYEQSQGVNWPISISDSYNGVRGHSTSLLLKLNEDTKPF